ncbi:ferrous iron transport protein A [Ligilactobacillus sp. WILCCON 0076]|uniref:Ferrous iron transport protein A n=1 Tax=Ligilactobacillus ubinensis TaxID=2876789 RepID=A0A9X2FJ53_9LACO|nr:ferrous iron transport protein A [Ligilactobacillus ubinensis]MCP0886405.1 ferrous iron transport protein A [Ligilactobacillus ubinensis]
MQTLAHVTNKGKYIITSITGEKALTRRLAEIGMIKGRIISVLSGNRSESGLVVVFQGQRLAVSAPMATCIEVSSVNQLDDETQLKPLSEMSLKTPCIVVKILGDKNVRKRLMDMGLTRNTLVTIQQVAPLGDPLELILRGYKLSIRNFEAQYILVQEVNM